MSTGHEFRLPDLGEGLTSADLVEWTVASVTRWNSIKFSPR